MRHSVSPSQQSLSVRQATTQDIPAIASLERKVVPEIYTPLVGPEYAQDLLDRWWTEAALQETMRSDRSLLLVAEQSDQAGSRIVGMAECEIQDVKAILWKIYLLPEWRGRGACQMLLLKCCSLLPGTIKWLYTEYLTTNASAGKFYERQGFVHRMTESDAQWAGQTYTWMKMAL